jgi:hypothetical protein
MLIYQVNLKFLVMVSKFHQKNLNIHLTLVPNKVTHLKNNTLFTLNLKPQMVKLKNLKSH